jgi:hypothetical protein
MAHFAELDGFVVSRVLVVDNSVLMDEQNNESEALGIAFLTSLFGHPNWKQTSYNNTFRKNFAGEGSTYDPVRDAFIPPEPASHQGLDEATCRWIVPESVK